jgi:kynureninase
VDRKACAELDRQDPLAHWRDRFECPEGVVYLDGNSLGALPKATAERLDHVVREEWGTGLIRSWNTAHWIDAPSRIGDKIARLIGAERGEVVATDSTSVNLFKLLAAAIKLHPDRPVILTEAQNFPTDLYIAEGLVDLLGGAHALRVVERADLEQALDDTVAVLALTHVDYASGSFHDMPRLTEAAHRRGALALWDLSHSAGALPMDLNASQADLAVGCGYKYLNGGPGAPAYLFVARRWQDALRSPLTGWMGHVDPFGFEARYRPAPGVQRQVAGTPPILAMAALEVGVDVWLQVDLQAARRKSQALGDLFIRLVDTIDGFELEIASPRDAAQRGSHVAVRHPQAYRVMRALIDAGVIGDFRTPDMMRFGFAALYTRYVDIWDAVRRLDHVLRSQAWARPEYARKLAVT